MSIKKSNFDLGLSHILKINPRCLKWIPNPNNKSQILKRAPISQSQSRKSLESPGSRRFCDILPTPGTATQECLNNDGSYTCPCLDGFYFSVNDNDCLDTDECATPMLNNCSMNANCTNIPGAFECDCLVGYSGDGVNCTNIDECLTANGGCDDNATCTDTDGSFVCSCDTGRVRTVV